MLEVLEQDRREARRYLSSEASATSCDAFALRQLRARERLTRLVAFYHRHSCRMARIHVLASSSVTLGRFCGFSNAFDSIGEAVMPVDQASEPRSDAWDRYAQACRDRRPMDTRDELWLEAHGEDWAELHERRLDEAFDVEAAANEGHPAWTLLRQHIDVTLGSRRLDRGALRGEIAYETAIAHSMALAVLSLFTRAFSLVRRHVFEVARALLSLRREAHRDLLGYRRVALVLLGAFIRSAGAMSVFRRGLRLRSRGHAAEEHAWSLLPEVLGDEVDGVHPLVSGFYSNPGRFDVRVNLKLHSVPLMFYSRLSALLVGQGLYESDEGEIAARLKVFRRADGSMHFVRELYCADKLRVFDSDFLVREITGKLSLIEVFVDLQVDVVLDVTVMDGGGVSVAGRDIYWRGVRLPRTGLHVEFVSHVREDAPGAEQLEIVGHLRMRPRTAVGRFVMYRLLRRPEQLGSIHYHLRPRRGLP